MKKKNLSSFYLEFFYSLSFLTLLKWASHQYDGEEVTEERLLPSRKKLLPIALPPPYPMAEGFVDFFIII